MASPKKGEDALRQKLEECGLDATYWYGVLESSFGVINLDQVRYLSEGDIERLANSKRWNWELPSLDQLITSSKDEKGGGLQQQMDNTKRRYDEAKLLVSQLKDINQLVEVRSKSNVKGKVEELRLLLGIPLEKWLKEYSQDAVNRVVADLSADIAQCDQLLKNQNDENYDVSDMLIANNSLTIKHMIELTNQIAVDNHLSEVSSVKDVDGLLKALQGLLSCRIKTDSVDLQNITKALAVCVCNLLDHLTRSGDCYMCSFLVTMLNLLSYNKKQMMFTERLTFERLKSFSGELEERLAEYRKYAEAGKVGVEAYLLHLVLETINDASLELSDRLQQASEPFLSKMASEVRHVIKTYKPTRNLPELTKALKKLMYNNEVAQDTKPASISDQGLAPLERIGLLNDNVDSSLRSLLVKLGLYEFYPQKIRLKDVVTIDESQEERKNLDFHDIPWVMIKRIMMANYEGRNTAWEGRLTETDYGRQCIGDDFENLLKDFEGTSIPDPMDIFLVTFSCCDLILRQILLEKMTMCRLAVPFVIPDPSETSLIFCLWALRSVVLEYSDRQRGMVESALVECPMKVVSFIRLGEIPSLSKSELLNCVLEQYDHAAFLNRQSCVKSSDRSIASGMIEATWYITSDKSDNLFDDVTMFLNLRGNASTSFSQVELLSAMPTIVTVVVDINSLADQSSVDTMRTLYQKQNQIVIVLTGITDEKKDAECLRIYWDKIGKIHVPATKIVAQSKGKNLKAICSEVRKILSELLKDAAVTTYEDLGQVMTKQNIQIDERDKKCQEGKVLADKITSYINMNDAPLDEIKENQLQIQELFLEWSRLQRKRKRVRGGAEPTNNLSEEIGKLDQLMATQREMQLQKCLQLSPLMSEFSFTLVGLIDEQDNLKVHFFLQWLRLFFDSRRQDHFLHLRQEYNRLLKEFQRPPDVDKPQDQSDQRNEYLKKIETKLAKTSFGVEHFFREVGQFYEAITESGLSLSSELQKLVDQLPSVVAELILSGHPFELMDGDSGNIPVTWVKAILKRLSSLTGDKRVFVLSVLGVQSSGKSTLLNTMFGLRFNVSVGRCTRGVYAQLVEVDKDKTGLPFDFILILDTEGLRNPELSFDAHERDNELATLVIGLGDIVIINVKGESVEDVKDTLQVAVHAFLRMKQVQLQQTCVFAHQNVSAPNANEKILHTRHHLLNKLDKMTEQAAEHEQMKHIHSFREIIDFDVNKNVWYLSDLWLGAPPMAPTNPGYSKRVTHMKKSLLFDIAKKPDRQTLSFTNLLTRIKGLWEAILAEDFVFSFRNTLGVQAYSALMDKYHEITWCSEKCIMEWFSDTAQIKLERCETEEILDATADNLYRQLGSKIEGLETDQIQELKQFFKCNSFGRYAIQWQEEQMISLKSSTSELARRIKFAIFEKRDRLKFELDSLNNHKKLEQAILVKAPELAAIAKGQILDDEELLQTFNEIWTSWSVSNPPPIAIESTFIQVQKDVENVLIEQLSRDRSAVRKELEANPLDRRFTEYSQWEQSFGVEKDDITLTMSQIEQLTKKLRGRVESEAPAKELIYQNAIKLFKIYKNEFFETIEAIVTTSTQFSCYNAKRVIKAVVKFVNDLNGLAARKYKFTFLPQFRVRLAVHVCWRAVQTFKEMVDEYRKKQSSQSVFEGKRTSALNLLKNMVNNSKAIAAAKLFCEKLETLIKKKVQENVSAAILRNVQNDYSRKRTFISAIMEDLALREDYDGWRGFFRAPDTFAYLWITDLINRKLFSSENQDEEGSYACLARPVIGEVLKGIHGSVEVASRHFFHDAKGPGTLVMKRWMEKFCNETADVGLAVRSSDMKSVLDLEVKDIRSFKECVQEQLCVVKKRLLNSVKEQNEALVVGNREEHPSEMLMNSLWGCCEVCPFCKEPCEWKNADHNHKKHSCIQHRPQFLGGLIWLEYDIITIETCNYLIQMPNAHFRCRYELDTCREEEELHPYSKYEKFYPSWEIRRGGTKEPSTFWKWFIAKYKQEIADDNNAMLPDIPKLWHQIDQKKALASLHEDD